MQSTYHLAVQTITFVDQQHLAAGTRIEVAYSHC